MSRPCTITVRITRELREKLDQATTAGPYAITATSIIERGIELALVELARMHRSAGDA